jgi:CRP-like cAMP-binding protein
VGGSSAEGHAAGSKPRVSSASGARRALSVQREEAGPCERCAFSGGASPLGLSEAARSMLMQWVIVRSYPAGTTLFHQGEPVQRVYCVQRGCVLSRWDDSGSESVVRTLAFESSVVGLVDAVSAGRVHASSAEVLTPLTACTIDARALDRVMRSVPEIAAAVAATLSAEVVQLVQHRMALLPMSIRRRMLKTIYDLREPCGTTNEDGSLVVTLPFSRRVLASLIGTTPESVSRSAQELKKSGLVRFEGRRVVVSDLDALLDAVEQVEPLERG